MLLLIYGWFYLNCINALQHVTADSSTEQCPISCQDEIQKLKDFTENLQAQIHDIQYNRASKPDMTMEEYYMFSGFGCVGEDIYLSCEGGSLILVTAADYGEYFHFCNSTCCPPHPGDDCTEPMEQNRPSEWEALKAACDNQPECNVTNQGSTFRENCTVNALCNYVVIFYSCLPESPSNHVGFTVYAAETRQYEAGHLILFDGIVTNYGGHFQTGQSVFICPYAATYVFYVSVSTVIGGRSMFVNLMMNDVYIISALADNQSDEYSNGSNMAVVHCNAGDRVWVESRTNGEEMKGGRESSFSGFLLHLDN